MVTVKMGLDYCGQSENFTKAERSFEIKICSCGLRYCWENRGALVIKNNIGCSSRGHKFNTKHPHGIYKQCVTPGI